MILNTLVYAEELTDLVEDKLYSDLFRIEEIHVERSKVMLYISSDCGKYKPRIEINYSYIHSLVLTQHYFESSELGQMVINRIKGVISEQ